MSVELEPTELGFRRPFQSEVSQVLRLRNNNSDPVAFKVKTTAPKQYCVRPNSGRIEPGEQIEVQVLLQAMKEDPAPDAKCRDKFLVQSVAVSADREFTNVASIWSHIEETNKSAIQEKKIRVVFLPPLENTAVSTPAKSNGVSTNGAPRSPTPDAVTPQHNASVQSTGSRSSSLPEEAQNAATTISSTVSNAAAGVASAVPTSSEELKQQLADAKNQIAKLKDQIDQGGLRQRKPAGDSAVTEKSSAGATATALRQPAASGVSVQIVAALCLLSFLLAYFFF